VLLTVTAMADIPARSMKEGCHCEFLKYIRNMPLAHIKQALIAIMLVVTGTVSNLGFAATYTLPDGTLPSGCTKVSNTSVTCSSLTLAWADTIVVTEANLKLTISNTLDVAGNDINISSPASGFVVQAKKFTGGSAVKLNGNILGDQKVTIGNASVITGAITSNDEVVLLPANTVVTGNITARKKVTLGSSCKVIGDIMADDEVILESSGSSVTGNINAKKKVTLGSSCAVTGDIVTDDEVVLQSSSSTVTGNIAAKKNVTLESSTSVTGNVTSLIGDVELKASSASISQCVTVDSNQSIILGWNASVGGACCLSGGAGGTCSATGCVTNNSGKPAPGACMVAPVADWRMDETAPYAGVAGEVKNSVGGGTNATATNGATNGAGKVCRAAASLSFWINTKQVGSNSPWTAPGVTGVEQNGGADDIFWGFINASGKIAVQKGNTLGAQSTSSINNGAWRHIVLTRDQSTGETKAYVDGVLEKTKNSATGLVTTAFASLGRIQTPFVTGVLSGSLDEVKVFAAVLSNAQVASIYANESAGKNWDGSERVCPVSGPHHLEILHPTGTGLTCAASTLTVRACADAACTNLYTGGVTGTLSAKVVTGTPTWNWDGTTGGATGAGFVIPTGSSSVTKNVQVSTLGSVEFGITTPTAINPTTCDFGSPLCTFNVSAAGFLFSNTPTGTTYTLPAQVSGVATGTLYLRAVQASTANAAVCTPAIISSTTQVNMGYTCNNPVACQAGNMVTINATSIAGSPDDTPTQFSTPVSLAFDTNGSAPITVRYDDVGQIILNASKTITPANGTAVTLKGSSNSFVVAPHHFGISGVTAAPIKAGSNFGATVTAYNGLSTPTATKNFGKETPPESASLSFSKCQPTGVGTSNGNFSGSVGSFNLGIASASNLNWSEVGNGDLIATLTNGSYLGSGLTATGNTGTSGTVCNSAGNVGRFIPDHFDTAVILASGVPMPCPTGLSCPIAYNGFAYSGQPFSVVVTAKNALSPSSQTVNYTYSATPSNSFAKDVTLSAVSAVGGSLISSTAPGGVLGANTAAAASFSLGSNVAAVAKPGFTFASSLTVPTNIYLRAVDTDLVSSLLTPASVSLEGGLKVVSGRIRIPNAYGSEILALPITATVQYYNGTYWVTSTTDNVTSFNTNLSTAGGNLVATVITGLASGVTVLNPGLSAVVSGVRTFTLNAPGMSGNVDITLNAPTYLPNASARASFGVFKSPLIYLRENY